MARINIDDDIESKDPFWALHDIVKNRYTALGMLVCLFRIAQKHYGQSIPISKETLIAAGLECMITSGWVQPVAGLLEGYQVADPDRHFAWSLQLKLGAVAGGRARAAAPRDEHGRYLPKPAGIQPSAGSLDQPHQPEVVQLPALSSAHSHSHAHSHKEEIHVDSASPTQPLQPGAVSHLARIWNLHCGALPKIRDPERLNSARARGAKNRLRERPSLEEWEEAIKRMANSPFCTGRSNRPGSHQNWRADFDFLLQPGRLDQALEGKWDAQTASGSGGVNLFSEIQGGNHE